MDSDSGFTIAVQTLQLCKFYRNVEPYTYIVKAPLRILERGLESESPEVRSFTHLQANWSLVDNNNLTLPLSSMENKEDK